MLGRPLVAKYTVLLHCEEKRDEKKRGDESRRCSGWVSYSYSLEPCHDAGCRGLRHHRDPPSHATPIYSHASPDSATHTTHAKTLTLLSSFSSCTTSSSLIGESRIFCRIFAQAALSFQRRTIGRKTEERGGELSMLEFAHSSQFIAPLKRVQSTCSLELNASLGDASVAQGGEYMRSTKIR